MSDGNKGNYGVERFGLEMAVGRNETFRSGIRN